MSVSRSADALLISFWETSVAEAHYSHPSLPLRHLTVLLMQFRLLQLALMVLICNIVRDAAGIMLCI